jgi:hypothetical protein
MPGSGEAGAGVLAATGEAARGVGAGTSSASGATVHQISTAINAASPAAIRRSHRGEDFRMTS